MENLKTDFNVKFGLILLLLFYGRTSPILLASNDTLLIKGCINQMFEGMSSFDSSLVRKSFADDFVLKSVIKSKIGVTSLKEESGETFLKIIGTKKPNVKYEERLLSFTLMVDKDMAVVWTPYHFYLNETFSHCGVNVFTMIKIKGDWKIMSITDTRRKEDC